MTTYHHLSSEERALIMLERQRGSSIRSIALRIHRSPSTVSRELQRNRSTKNSYCATRAAKAYILRRKHSVKPRKLIHNTDLCDIVESHLIQRKWSPEQISVSLQGSFPGQSSMQIK